MRIQIKFPFKRLYDPRTLSYYQEQANYIHICLIKMPSHEYTNTLTTKSKLFIALNMPKSSYIKVICPCILGLIKKCLNI